MIRAILVALCLISSSALAATPKEHASEECFANAHQLRQVYKTEYYKWRMTPNGWCYHLGSPHQKTVSHSTKPSPSPAGGGTGIVKAKAIPHQHLLDIDAAISLYSKRGGRDLIDFMFGR